MVFNTTSQTSLSNNINNCNNISNSNNRYSSSSSNNNSITIDNDTFVCDDYSGDECMLYSFVAYTLFIGTFCIIGLVGNSVSYVVFRRTNVTSSTLFLFQSLSVVDNVLLLTIIPMYCFEPFVIFTGYFQDYLYCGYKFIVHAVFFPWASVSQTATVWLTVLVGINRYIAVCKPYQTAKLCTVRQAKIQLSGVLAFSLLYNIPKFFEVFIVRKKYIYNNMADDADGAQCFCVVVSSYYFSQAYRHGYESIMYTIFMLILPLSLLSILNILLILQLKKLKKRRAEMQSARQQQDNNVTLVLIIVILVFIFCQTPALINRFMWSFFADDQRECPGVQYYFSRFGNMMVSVNSAVNFFIYIIFNSRFRQVFIEKTLFGRCCRICCVIPSSSANSVACASIVEAKTGFANVDGGTNNRVAAANNMRTDLTINSNRRSTIPLAACSHLKAAAATTNLTAASNNNNNKNVKVLSDNLKEKLDEGSKSQSAECDANRSNEDYKHNNNSNNNTHVDKCNERNYINSNNFNYNNNNNNDTTIYNKSTDSKNNNNRIRENVLDEQSETAGGNGRPANMNNGETNLTDDAELHVGNNAPPYITTTKNNNISCTSSCNNSSNNINNNNNKIKMNKINNNKNSLNKDNIKSRKKNKKVVSVNKNNINNHINNNISSNSNNNNDIINNSKSERVKSSHNDETSGKCIEDDDNDADNTEFLSNRLLKKCENVNNNKNNNNQNINQNNNTSNNNTTNNINMSNNWSARSCSSSTNNNNSPYNNTIVRNNNKNDISQTTTATSTIINKNHQNNLKTKLGNKKFAATSARKNDTTGLRSVKSFEI
ncbi:hypothetical protein HELRODRAFT_177152 [Helobdella robusta]|uniref:G-protein coupled receptors family 1 profile domain-containing protein n=1 Tax=Helobdella robusta TaxID=6412 RepID=T1FBA1_HELRO|nr:hypothetical protein HELRODRAFT_177152 [Helobdella robusta]ESN98270.1 hypothetical protein HELRODRAFT_177152 [Helobdella robusta]